MPQPSDHKLHSTDHPSDHSLHSHSHSEDEEHSEVEEVLKHLFYFFIHERTIV